MSARSPRPSRPGTVVEHRGAPLRTKPTTGNRGPRDRGPHGKTTPRPRRLTSAERAQLFRGVMQKLSQKIAGQREQ